ncbi:MAG TPA: glycosyltransferase family 61 protein [Candidatus Saccharimonadales bacterium]|nr:glycosyltransferase family 61 protein [Candidatus Saccharimonadales bacterium]
MKKICAFLYLILASDIQATTIQQLSIKDFVAQYPSSQQIKCTNKMSFAFNPFPLYQDIAEKYFPCQGFFLETSILEIPKGKMYLDDSGYVFVNDCFIKETQIKGLNYFSGPQFNIPDTSTSMRLSGRVAVISHLYPYCYGHWIFDVLGQLALLELFNVQYDYLCVPYYNKFMLETLELWGVERSKIIPLTPKLCLKAGTLIMPTSVTQIDALVYGANYNIDLILQHVRKKLLAGAMCTQASPKDEIQASHEAIQALPLATPDRLPDTVPGTVKVFISRKDAGGKRAVPNEDEIFALFETLGFKRYELTSLSLAEQILLFHNAKTIVSFLGSGSTNIMFCNPGTHYIEIIQSLIDATFFYVADLFHLQYSCINNSTVNDLGCNPWASPSQMPLDFIQDFLKKHPNL